MSMAMLMTMISVTKKDGTTSVLTEKCTKMLLRRKLMENTITSMSTARCCMSGSMAVKLL